MTPLFTEAHIQEQQDRLYKLEDYSTGCLDLIEPLSDFINENQFSGIIDYGCGLARPAELLKFEFPIDYFPYDPAVPEFSTRPVPKPMTMAINSLEYCEPEYVSDIINDLASLTLESSFIAINTRLLGGICPTTMRANDWWIKALSKAFDFVYYRKVGDGFILLAEPRNKSPGKEQMQDSIINTESPTI